MCNVLIQEKLFATKFQDLSNYHITKMRLNLMAKHIRDIYDLCQLFHTRGYTQMNFGSNAPGNRRR